jgi:hypothetical protein
MVRLIGIVVVLCVLLVGCTDDRTHAQIMSGDLRYLYGEWLKAGKPGTFETSNYIAATQSRYMEFTNSLAVGAVTYHCRFAVRSPGRFSKPGVVAITDSGMLFWVGDDHTVIPNPGVNGIKLKKVASEKE